jgi:hypothetical protein
MERSTAYVLFWYNDNGYSYVAVQAHGNAGKKRGLLASVLGHIYPVHITSINDFF